MSMYTDHHTGLLEKAGASSESLPGDLSLLIGKFQRAASALQEADAGTQQRLSFILVQADAVICAAIYSLYKDRLHISDILPEREQTPPQNKIDKVKLLAMKAKALQLKNKRNN